jgi:integrase
LASTVEGKAWTPEQARRFLAKATEDGYAAAWRLSLRGLRRGEVLALTWDSIDVDRRTARISASRVLLGGKIVTNPPKTRAGVRTIPLVAEAVADVKALKILQAAEPLAAGPGCYPDTGGMVFRRCPRHPATP